MNGLRVHISGIVQGVGFRPFVYGLAVEHALNGWVRNSSAGVDIEVDGERAVLESFLKRLENEIPPLARIDIFETDWIPAQGFNAFKIVHSEADDGFVPISPDVCICEDCLEELFTPDNFRYRYPFINCTNCGPRFTIIGDVPYDRPYTTMRHYPMCPACQAEYEDPLNRRFHAQPVACPECGPQIWYEASGEDPGLEAENSPAVMAHLHNPVGEEALAKTRAALMDGKIMAIKGLGGFHLACDATNQAAVRKLRERKLRREKPFAVMMPDIEAVQKYCHINDAERELLSGRVRPIVLLERKPGTAIAEEVAPRVNTLGVMLPYTPLHYLLMEQVDGFTDALVMTSANLSEEPIAYRNEDARERLGTLADAFLMNNRDIYLRVDDSVTRVEQGRPTVIRRSRGYAPDPVPLPFEVPPILAAGPELKNTFCLTRDKYAFLSQHIGDMENYETLKSFEEGIEHMQRLFRIQPEVIAYDLHPNYLASRYALQRAREEHLPLVGVQHHHAHIAACMADNGLDGTQKVIGLSFDGTGYGDDGTIWGGEVLLADYSGFERSFYLQPFPLPGGDQAVKNPWRTGLSLAIQARIPMKDILAFTKLEAQAVAVVRSQIEKGINAPMTSSMGRLFDGVAALAGVRLTVNYEAQAAIEFEEFQDDGEGGAYEIGFDGRQMIVTGMLHQLVQDAAAGVSMGVISSRFHRGIANAALAVSVRLRDSAGIKAVALSGGVWQNTHLKQMTIRLLDKAGFDLLTHSKVPTNDGGIALGQAVIAAWKLSNG